MKVKPVIKTEIIPVTEVAKTSTETVLARLKSDLMAAVLPTGYESLFPQLKLVYPIDMQNQAEFFNANDCFKLGLFDGKAFKQLLAPYTLAAIASKNASRELIEHEDSEPTFNRAYAGGKTAELYAEHCKAEKELGATFVVVVVTESAVALAEFSTFKTALGYWGKPLSQTSLKGRIGMKVNITDHTANLTKGARGFSYIDPKKFKQHEQIELLPPLIEKVAGLLQADWSKFEAWLAK